MNTRIFTVEQARELLPEVRRIVAELRRLRREITDIHGRISLLEALWQNDVRDEDNPDAKEYRECKVRNRRLVREFRRKSQELDDLGCHVKNLDEMEIGFFHVRDGKAVFMSWNLNDADYETYDELESNARVFGVEEARGMLPRLGEIFAEVDRFTERLQKARHELKVLAVLWGDDVHEETQPDAQRVRELTQEIERMVNRGRELEREIHRAGCVLKDFHQGLVDFYHVRDGRIVFLCWRRDEPDILAWHPIDAGFMGRQPLDSDG